MNKTEAKKLGKEFKSRGLTYQQVAVELGKRGYRTGQGQEPQWYDINYLLNKERFSSLTARRRSQAKSSVAPLSNNDIRVVREVIRNNKIDSDKKIEIIKIVLENKNTTKIEHIDIGL